MGKTISFKFVIEIFHAFKSVTFTFESMKYFRSVFKRIYPGDITPCLTITT